MSVTVNAVECFTELIFADFIVFVFVTEFKEILDLVLQNLLSFFFILLHVLSDLLHRQETILILVTFKDLINHHVDH